MTKHNNGGPAFPVEVQVIGDRVEGAQTGNGRGYATGISMRDYFAAHAPYPTEQQIASEMGYDRNRNPHNEPHRPYIRERHEVVADLMFKHADAMLAAREKRNG